MEENEQRIHCLTEAVSASEAHSIKLVNELMKTRMLILAMMRELREHPRTGYNIKLVFSPEIHGQISDVEMGNYLTKELEDG